MDPNPYKPPVVMDQPLAAARSPFRVEGKYLVVFSGAELPLRCVRTNEKITEEDMRRKTYEWCSPWVALTFLISGCITIVLYFVLRKRCEITFGMHPSVRARYRNWLIFKMLAVVGLFIAMPIAAASDSTGLIAASIVLFIIAVVAVFIGNSPLRITSHHQGEFWIKGCCPDFLSDLLKGEQTGNPFGDNPPLQKPV